MKPNFRNSRALRAALVVDDDEANRKLISSILQRERFLTTWASNGAEAIAALGRSDFSVIVLDLVMPEVNGQEVIRHLRQTRPDMLRRVIVLTALSEIDVPPELVFQVIRKPFEFRKFVAVICECAEQSVLETESA
ncbi:MAG TPA: response regulator [Thermoanaerobaculia bacterium]|nr:response regulator [Thermoanaerobaculia bacterium]